MEPLPEHNRRRYRRIPAYGLVQFRSSSGTYSGYLANISQGGLMLKARDLPDPDERITLHFQLHPSQVTQHLTAIVVWIASNSSPNALRGMGARFIDQGEEEIQRVVDYFDSFSSSGPL